MPRPRNQTDAVTMKDLVECRDFVALLVRDYGEQYIPLFDRFQQEIDARQSRSSSYQRILAHAELVDPSRQAQAR